MRIANPATERYTFSVLPRRDGGGSLKALGGSLFLGGSLLMAVSLQVLLPSGVSLVQAQAQTAPYRVALSIREAIELVQRQKGGRILAAVPIESEGRAAYRIKVLQGNGRVITVIVDAISGQITEG